MNQPKSYFVLLCDEPDTDPYVLTDAFSTLEAAQLAAKHRCEEFIDELVTIAADMGVDGVDCSIVDQAESFKVMSNEADLLRIDIQAITVVEA